MSGPTREGEIVVAAARSDAAACSVVAALRRAGRPARLVDEGALARAVLVHRPASGLPAPGTRAMPGDRLRLPDGSELGPATAVLVWRLETLPVAAVSAEHREYAQAEAFAAGLSWLTGLGENVLNRPTPLGLGGARIDLLRLAQLCEEGSLAIAPFELCTNQAASRPVPGVQAWAWDPQGLADPQARRTPLPAGPPLPRPVVRTSAVQPTEPVLVLDGRVVGSPALPAAALAAVVAAAGLRCAEVATGIAADGRPVVIAISPLPKLRAPGHFAAFLAYLVELADRMNQEQAA